MDSTILFYLVQANFIDFMIVAFLFIFLISNTTISKEVNRVFLFTTIILTVLIFADSIDFYLAQDTIPHALRYFTSATGYTLRPFPVVMFVIVSKHEAKFKNVILFLSLFINGILAYTSIFTKWMFYFDENNQFHRGPVGVLPFIISGVYLIVLLVRSVERYRLGYIREGQIVIFIVLTCTLASALETIFHFKFFINGVGAISAVFYYLFLHTQTFKRDGLTEAFNRRTFYADCNEYSRKSMIVVSVDINNLKIINDTKGHSQGDLAIVTVAHRLNAAFATVGNLYRIGGDEFVLLCPGATVETVRAKMKIVEQDLKNTTYRFAWGYATYHPSMNLEEVLSQSDAKMYEDKQSKKMTVGKVL